MYRLRFSQTLRNLNGRRAVFKALRYFMKTVNSKGYGHAPDVTTSTHPEGSEDRSKEALKALCAPDAILRQRALFSQATATETYRFVAEHTLTIMQIPMPLSHLQRRRLDQEMNWFWETVCLRGERILCSSLGEMALMFRRHWEITSAPRFVYHVPHDTADLDDDVIVSFREVEQQRNADATWGKWTLREGSRGSSLGTPLEGEEYIVESEVGHSVVDTIGHLYQLLRSQHVGRDDVEIDRIRLFHPNGHPIEIRSVTTLGSLMGHELSDYEPSKELREYHKKMIFPLFFALSTADMDCPLNATKQTDGSNAGRRKRRSNPLKPLLPFAKDKWAVPLPPPSNFILELRRQESIAHAEFEYPKFSREALFNDTNESLRRILDQSLPSRVANILRLLSGGDTVFDYEVHGEFFYRDAIPQLRAISKTQSAPSDEPKTLGQPSHEQTKTKDSLCLLECFFDRPESALPNASLTVTYSADQDGRRTIYRSRLPVLPPQHVPIFHPSGDSQKELFSRNGQSHRKKVDPAIVKAAYDEAYETVVHLRDSRGKRRGILRAYDAHEASLLVAHLGSLYETLEARLEDADGDPNAIEPASIALEFSEAIEDVSSLVPIVTTEEQIFDVMYSINAHIVLVQVLYAIYFFASCWVGARDAIAREHYASRWDWYNVAYFRFMNSGTPLSILGAAATRIVVNREERASSYYWMVVDWGLLTIASAMVLPAVMTHIIPATFVFLWVLLMVFTVFAAPAIMLFFGYTRLKQRWIQPDLSEDERGRRFRRLRGLFTAAMLWTQFSMFIFLTAVFQTSFNWANLLYNRRHLQLSYADVVIREWNSRNAGCYFEDIFNTDGNIVQFFATLIG
jgi:hypothetical protein